jgi:hypothetical protein
VGEDEVEKMAKEACHDLEVYMWLHELKKLWVVPFPFW